MPLTANGSFRCYLLNHDSEPSAYNLAVFLKLVKHIFSHVNRYGETNADVTAALAENGSIDANHFSFQIEESAAGVTRVDGGVGLNKITIGLGRSCGGRICPCYR